MATRENNTASDFQEEGSKQCQPCSFEWKSKNAEHFCQDCQEYLCQKCSTYHKALTATRSHVLVPKDMAKEAPPKTTTDKCSAKCSAHNDKTVKFFCLTDSYLGCSVCMTMEHKRCQKTEFIPKEAVDIANHEAFKTFHGQLITLETACKSYISDVEKHLKEIKADEIVFEEAVEQLRKRLNDAVDKLADKARQISRDETKKLDGLSKNLIDSLANVTSLKDNVNALLSRGKHCDVYVIMRKEGSRLATLEREIANEFRSATFQRYAFRPNEVLLKDIALGDLRMTGY